MSKFCWEADSNGQAELVAGLSEQGAEQGVVWRQHGDFSGGALQY